jgi:alkylhydroperoxidase/carboxymuconolactone decarboxylase family protein YurZ
MADAEARQRGQAVVKQLFGQERDMANPTAWDEIILDHLFGTIWSRPQLPIRDRSLITVAALTALGKDYCHSDQSLLARPAKDRLAVPNWRGNCGVQHDAMPT